MRGLHGPQTGDNDRRYGEARSVYAAGFAYFAREQARMESRAELTVRGFLLGGAITLVFTAANVYLGLKSG